jgi:nucleoside-diphosphate-sugar epimerase
MAALAGETSNEKLSEISRFTKIKCMVEEDSDLNTIGLAESDYEVHRGDIRNADDVERFLKGADGATIFHCAGLIHPKLRTKELFDTNVGGAKNLARASANANVKKMVVVSSNSVTGATTDRNIVYDEHSRLNPYMAYGRSKAEMENIFDSAATELQFELVTLRVPWFYGPNQPERQSKFFSLIRQGRVPVVGSGDNLRSLAYVDDIATSLVLAASSLGTHGTKYWISDRQPYRYNEIIDTIENLLVEHFDIEVANRRMKLPNIAGNVARVADRTIQGTGLYNQNLHVLGELNLNIACDPSLAITELGYEPSVGLREGMLRSIESCLTRGHSI